VHCFCPNGFKGRFCAEDIDECATATSHTSPCSAPATCINTHGSYLCNCTARPATLCYNQLSPQYSASRTDQQYKYYGRTDTEDLILTDEGTVQYANDRDLYADGNAEQDTILFGVVSARTLRQGLLGFFGGICGLLVVLSLAAGFVCQVNLSRRRMYASQEFRTDENTETPLNTDSLAECLSSGGSNSNGEDACPTSSCVSMNSLSASSGQQQQRRLRERMAKNRTSMTVSLLSSTNGEDGNEASSGGKQQWRQKYSINNLLFARLRNEKRRSEKLPVAEGSVVVVVEEKAEERPIEMYGLVKDADDEAVKPIRMLAELKNDMSSFSRRKTATGQVVVNPMFKFNTMRSGQSEASKSGSASSFGHHTISGRSGGGGGFIRPPVQMAVSGGSTTLLARAASGCYLDLDVEKEQDDSIQTIEDNNCQGLC